MAQQRFTKDIPENIKQESYKFLEKLGTPGIEYKDLQETINNIEVLLEAYPGLLNENTNQYGATPLHSIAFAIDKFGDNRQTLLIEFGHRLFGIAKKHDVNINFTKLNKHKDTTLHAMLWRGCADIAKKIIEGAVKQNQLKTIVETINDGEGNGVNGETPYSYLEKGSHSGLTLEERQEIKAIIEKGLEEEKKQQQSRHAGIPDPMPQTVITVLVPTQPQSIPNTPFVTNSISIPGSYFSQSPTSSHVFFPPTLVPVDILADLKGKKDFVEKNYTVYERNRQFFFLDKLIKAYENIQLNISPLDKLKAALINSLLDYVSVAQEKNFSDYFNILFNNVIDNHVLKILIENNIKIIDLSNDCVNRIHLSEKIRELSDHKESRESKKILGIQIGTANKITVKRDLLEAFKQNLEAGEVAQEAINKAVKDISKKCEKKYSSEEFDDIILDGETLAAIKDFKVDIPYLTYRKIQIQTQTGPAPSM